MAVALFDQPGCGLAWPPTRGACLRPRFLDLPQGPFPKHSLGRPSRPALHQQGGWTGAAFTLPAGKLSRGAESLLQLPPCGIDVLGAATPHFSTNLCRDRAPVRGAKSAEIGLPNGLKLTSRRPNTNSRPSAWIAPSLQNTEPGRSRLMSRLVRIEGDRQQPPRIIEKAPEQRGLATTVIDQEQLTGSGSVGCLLAQTRPCAGASGASPSAVCDRRRPKWFQGKTLAVRQFRLRGGSTGAANWRSTGQQGPEATPAGSGVERPRPLAWSWAVASGWEHGHGDAHTSLADLWGQRLQLRRQRAGKERTCSERGSKRLTAQVVLLQLSSATVARGSSLRAPLFGCAAGGLSRTPPDSRFEPLVPNAGSPSAGRAPLENWSPSRFDDREAAAYQSRWCLIQTSVSLTVALLTVFDGAARGTPPAAIPPCDLLSESGWKTAGHRLVTIGCPLPD